MRGYRGSTLSRRRDDSEHDSFIHQSSESTTATDLSSSNPQSPCASASTSTIRQNNPYRPTSPSSSSVPMPQLIRTVAISTGHRVSNSNTNNGDVHEGPSPLMSTIEDSAAMNASRYWSCPRPQPEMSFPSADLADYRIGTARAAPTVGSPQHHSQVRGHGTAHEGRSSTKDYPVQPNKKDALNFGLTNAEGRLCVHHDPTICSHSFAENGPTTRAQRQPSQQDSGMCTPSDSHAFGGSYGARGVGRQLPIENGNLSPPSSSYMSAPDLSNGGGGVYVAVGSQSPTLIRGGPPPSALLARPQALEEEEEEEGRREDGEGNLRRPQYAYAYPQSQQQFPTRATPLSSSSSSPPRVLIGDNTAQSRQQTRQQALPTGGQTIPDSQHHEGFCCCYHHEFGHHNNVQPTPYYDQRPRFTRPPPSGREDCSDEVYGSARPPIPTNTNDYGHRYHASDAPLDFDPAERHAAPNSSYIKRNPDGGNQSGRNVKRVGGDQQQQESEVFPSTASNGRALAIGGYAHNVGGFEREDERPQYRHREHETLRREQQQQQQRMSPTSHHPRGGGADASIPSSASSYHQSSAPPVLSSPLLPTCTNLPSPSTETTGIAVLPADQPQPQPQDSSSPPPLIAVPQTPTAVASSSSSHPITPSSTMASSPGVNINYQNLFIPKLPEQLRQVDLMAILTQGTAMVLCRESVGDKRPKAEKQLGAQQPGEQNTTSPVGGGVGEGEQSSSGGTPLPPPPPYPGVPQPPSSVIVALNADTGQSKRFGFAYFPTATDGFRTLSALNGRDIVYHFSDKKVLEVRSPVTATPISQNPAQTSWQLPAYSASTPQQQQQRASAAPPPPPAYGTASGANVATTASGEAANASNQNQNIELAPNGTLTFRLTITGSKFDGRQAAAVCSSLYVRNIPVSVPPDQIRKMLSRYGTIAYFSHRKDSTNAQRPIWVVFVEYDSIDSATKALDELHGNHRLFPEASAPILAKYADTQEQREQRKLMRAEYILKHKLLKDREEQRQREAQLIQQQESGDLPEQRDQQLNDVNGCTAVSSQPPYVVPSAKSNYSAPSPASMGSAGEGEGSQTNKHSYSRTYQENPLPAHPLHGTAVANSNPNPAVSAAKAHHHQQQPYVNAHTPPLPPPPPSGFDGRGPHTYTKVRGGGEPEQAPLYSASVDEDPCMYQHSAQQKQQPHSAHERTHCSAGGAALQLNQPPLAPACSYVQTYQHVEVGPRYNQPRGHYHHSGEEACAFSQHLPNREQSQQPHYASFPPQNTSYHHQQRDIEMHHPRGNTYQDPFLLKQHQQHHAFRSNPPDQFPKFQLGGGGAAAYPFTAVIAYNHHTHSHASLPEEVYSRGGGGGVRVGGVGGQQPYTNSTHSSSMFNQQRQYPTVSSASSAYHAHAHLYPSDNYPPRTPFQNYNTQQTQQQHHTTLSTRKEGQQQVNDASTLATEGGLRAQEGRGRPQPQPQPHSTGHQHLHQHQHQHQYQYISPQVISSAAWHGSSAMTMRGTETTPILDLRNTSASTPYVSQRHHQHE